MFDTDTKVLGLWADSMKFTRFLSNCYKCDRVGGAIVSFQK